MTRPESGSEYLKAVKMGQKECAALQAKGQNPFPLVLDQIVSDGILDAAQFIGTTEIPIERIIGVKSAGRISAFSSSFYPLLDSETEFAMKWIRLCDSHLGDEGIRDPIVCFEFLGNFYIQEGNKRLSVLKYFGAARISSMVYRVIPPMSEDPKVRVYYEFLEFYKCAKVYDIYFTKPGNYAALLSCTGLPSSREWSEDERRRFRAYFQYFREAFESLGGRGLHIRPEEALLLWLQVHPYGELGSLSGKQLRKTLGDMWDNVTAIDLHDPILRTDAPDLEEKPNFISRLLNPRHINVAFVHQRTVKSSPWTSAHDVGRKYLEDTLGDAVTVRSYFCADSMQQAEDLLEQAVADGAEVIFTTTPQLIAPSLKVSIRYPKVRLLNCSVHMLYSTVRTYYSRIYEGKFITGAIAGAVADNNRIGYVGSYPIFGVPASINAFALGAQLTNPRAQIELKWSCLPGNPTQEFIQDGIKVISNRDTPEADKLCTEYGTYFVDSSGAFIPLGSPCWIWGKFYERVIRSILAGTWDNRCGQVINDWWGLQSGVIDVKLADNLPAGVKTMARYLRDGIKNGTIDPFCREIIDQNGTVRNDGTRPFTADELLRMDWLCENVHGVIPQFEDILPISRPTVRILGIYRDAIPTEHTMEPSEAQVVVSNLT